MERNRHAWKLLMFLFFTVATLCESRVVTVPAGPLVRVEGQSVSIPCNISDYEGPRDQEFEWSLILDNGAEVQLISTFDPSYPDPSVKDRVSSGAISIKKLSDASVELIITKLRASDSVTYRCSTPSTDSVISGNYQADVELRVIGDTLKVVPAIPQPVVSEGEPLELQCNASRAYTAHTFLSITWSIRKETNSLEDILTFGPDSGVKVGQDFAQRYADGGLFLDLREGGFYGLVIKGAKPSDQGAFVCTAREWTRQPGGGKGWHKILERSEEMGKVTVTPLVIGDTLKVVPAIPQPVVSEGEPLELQCNANWAYTAHTFLSITWSISKETNSLEDILKFGPDIGVKVGQDFAERYADGGLFLDLREGGFYRLVIKGVKPSDQGTYVCTAREWTRQPGGGKGWHKILERSEEMGKVTVTPLGGASSAAAVPLAVSIVAVLISALLVLLYCSCWTRNREEQELDMTFTKVEYVGLSKQ